MLFITNSSALACAFTLGSEGIIVVFAFIVVAPVSSAIVIPLPLFSFNTKFCVSGDSIVVVLTEWSFAVTMISPSVAVIFPAVAVMFPAVEVILVAAVI